MFSLYRLIIPSLFCLLVAVKVAAQSNHQIGPAVTVKTLLLKDDDYCEKGR